MLTRKKTTLFLVFSLTLLTHNYWFVHLLLVLGNETGGTSKFDFSVSLSLTDLTGQIPQLLSCRVLCNLKLKALMFFHQKNWVVLTSQGPGFVSWAKLVVLPLFVSDQTFKVFQVFVFRESTLCAILLNMYFPALALIIRNPDF